VIANIPIGQTTQALVYVPNAVPEGRRLRKILPRKGEAAKIVRLHLGAGGSALANAQASAAVNSLGLVDLVEIAASGLSPKSQYDVYIAENNQAPFGKLEPLAVLKTNPDGAGIVQAVGPLKVLAAGSPGGSNTSSRRFLIITEKGDPSHVVLSQASASNGQ
jgi:hypothetical protein